MKLPNFREFFSEQDVPPSGQGRSTRHPFSKTPRPPIGTGPTSGSSAVGWGKPPTTNNRWALPGNTDTPETQVLPGQMRQDKESPAFPHPAPVHPVQPAPGMPQRSFGRHLPGNQWVPPAKKKSGFMYDDQGRLKEPPKPGTAELFMFKLDHPGEYDPRGRQGFQLRDPGVLSFPKSPLVTTPPEVPDDDPGKRRWQFNQQWAQQEMFRNLPVQERLRVINMWNQRAEDIDNHTKMLLKRKEQYLAQRAEGAVKLIPTGERFPDDDPIRPGGPVYEIDQDHFHRWLARKESNEDTRHSLDYMAQQREAIKQMRDEAGNPIWNALKPDVWDAAIAIVTLGASAKVQAAVKGAKAYRAYRKATAAMKSGKMAKYLAEAGRTVKKTRAVAWALNRIRKNGGDFRNYLKDVEKRRQDMKEMKTKLKRLRKQWVWKPGRLRGPRTRGRTDVLQAIDDPMALNLPKHGVYDLMMGRIPGSITQSMKAGDIPGRVINSIRRGVGHYKPSAVAGDLKTMVKGGQAGLAGGRVSAAFATGGRVAGLEGFEYLITGGKVHGGPAEKAVMFIFSLAAEPIGAAGKWLGLDQIKAEWVDRALGTAQEFQDQLVKVTGYPYNTLKEMHDNRDAEFIIEPPKGNFTDIVQPGEGPRPEGAPTPTGTNVFRGNMNDPNSPNPFDRERK